MSVASRTLFARSSALLGAGLLAACTTSPPPRPETPPPAKDGAVSYDLIPAGASGQYKLKTSEHAFGAQPIERPSPAYPEALIAAGLPPVVVRVKAIIGEKGTVTDVRSLDATNDPQHAAFVAACRDAVSRWTYSPMVVVEEFDDGKGNISQVRTPKAFSQDYAFRFELVEGKPKVSAGQ